MHSWPQRKEDRTNVTHDATTARSGPEKCEPAGFHDGRLQRRRVDSLRGMRPRRDRVAKLSGIGCSSKTPAYFLSKSHGFNGVHGRMPAIATGVMLANKSLISIGVSGDGDTASIGMGQFVHLLRR